VTDFSDADPLPRQTESELIEEINRSVGDFPFSAVANDNENEDGEPSRRPDGSYLNSDIQVVYQVYLMYPEKRADISGVPLRYIWEWTPAKSSYIRSIKAMSQEFDGQSAVHVPDPRSDPEGGYSQYDAVVLYQTAGVFRQMRSSDPASFARFVTKACSH
jgi:hypothetical protein